MPPLSSDALRRRLPHGIPTDEGVKAGLRRNYWMEHIAQQEGGLSAPRRGRQRPPPRLVPTLQPPAQIRITNKNNGPELHKPGTGSSLSLGGRGARLVARTGALTPRLQGPNGAPSARQLFTFLYFRAKSVLVTYRWGGPTEGRRFCSLLHDALR